MEDGREHCFRMFGSGTLADARTWLSRSVMVNPSVIATEARELSELGVADPCFRMSISWAAPVTTPFHVALNRLRELTAGSARQGSSGMGIGLVGVQSTGGHS